MVIAVWHYWHTWYKCNDSTGYSCMALCSNNGIINYSWLSALAKGKHGIEEDSEYVLHFGTLINTLIRLHLHVHIGMGTHFKFHAYLANCIHSNLSMDFLNDL